VKGNIKFTVRKPTPKPEETQVSQVTSKLSAHQLCEYEKDEIIGSEMVSYMGSERKFWKKFKLRDNFPFTGNKRKKKCDMANLWLALKQNFRLHLVINIKIKKFS